VLLGLFAVLTLASVAYNAATGRAASSQRLSCTRGRFVRVDGKASGLQTLGGARGRRSFLLGGFYRSELRLGTVSALGSAGTTVCSRLDLPPFGYTERRGPYTLRGLDRPRARPSRRGFGLHHSVLVGHSLGAAVVCRGCAVASG